MGSIATLPLTDGPDQSQRAVPISPRRHHANLKGTVMDSHVTDLQATELSLDELGDVSGGLDTPPATVQDPPVSATQPRSASLPIPTISVHQY
jgi:hypothetical protein